MKDLLIDVAIACVILIATAIFGAIMAAISMALTHLFGPDVTVGIFLVGIILFTATCFVHWVRHA